MDRKLYAHEDNVRAQLNAGISAAVLTIPLKTGEGASFPQPLTGTATSVGDINTLNDTGIGASGIAVGDVVENLTDGSYAVVKTVNTDSVETTRLKGGSDNLWQSGDVWVTNRFIVTLIQYDTDGTTVLKREKVLINNRSTDSLTVDASGRGFDGSTAQSFDPDDYVYLFWTSAAADGLKQGIVEALKYADTNKDEIEALGTSKADDTAVVHDTGNETIAGIKTFSSIPILPNSDPVGDNDVARKKFVVDTAGSPQKIAIQVLAGETIDTSSTPQAVYIKSTDGEFYKTDADGAESTYKFQGFAITNGTDGNSFYVVKEGVVSGFSGLTPGATYFLSGTAGVISTTPGTYQLKVGIAVSTTQLLIVKDRPMYAYVLSASASANLNEVTADVTVTVGFRPTKISGVLTIGPDNISPVNMANSGGSVADEYFIQSLVGAIAWVNGSYLGYSHHDDEGGPSGSIGTNTSYLGEYTAASQNKRVRLSVLSIDETSVTFRIAVRNTSNPWDGYANALLIIEG